MADVIQFPCPVCGATLRLPLEMAGRQGPCPCCGTEIIAPDPYRGIGACEVPPAPPPTLVEPFKPFVETPAVVSPPPPPPAAPAAPQAPETAAPPEPTPQPEESQPVNPPRESNAPPAVPAAPPASSGPAVFVLSILLTAVVSLVAGYLLGARSNWLVSRTPYPVMKPTESVTTTAPAAVSPPPVDPPILVKPAAPAPPVETTEPVPPPPAAEPTPVVEPDKVPEPKKASAMAEVALKAFLDAPDWTTRSAYVLQPERVRAAMEEYSRKHPDGPTVYQSVSVENSYTDKATGNTLFIFKVVTELLPSGFPVAVSETSSGWNVDWQSFVEFRDDHFKSFADGPPGKSGAFHVIVSSPPAPRAANTENEHFSSFLLDPPLPGRQRIAYAKKTSGVHEQLTAATAGGTIFTPVLEIAKRSTPDGKSYLEILDLKASDWLPRSE